MYWGFSKVQCCCGSGYGNSFACSGFPGHVVPECELLLLGLKSKAKLFCVSACELREILSPGVSDFCCLIGLGAAAFFIYLVSMCWWRVAMFGL